MALRRARAATHHRLCSPAHALLVYLAAIAVPAAATCADTQLPSALTSAGSYTWIFAGVLPTTTENFSGTLVAGSAEAQFELRLGHDVTCDGDRLEDDGGVVKLHALACSDGRTLRARFVPEGGTDLRVFIMIDDQEFIADAHLIDFDAPLDAAGRDRWPPALPPVPRQPISAH